MIEEYVDTILQMQRDGKSIKRIAKELYIHAPSLYAYMSNHRDIFPKARTYKILSKDERTEIRKAYFTQNRTQKSLADQYGVNVNTIRRCLRNYKDDI